MFVYAGLLSKGRGIEILLDLFSTEFDGTDLVFLGHGELKHLVLENTAFSKNIHYLPPVEHSKVVQTLQSANYGFCFIEKVSLSDYYCLPNKLLNMLLQVFLLLHQTSQKSRKC